jgi:hypothetical protein
MVFWAYWISIVHNGNFAILLYEVLEESAVTFWTCKMCSGIRVGTWESYHCWLFKACFKIVHSVLEGAAKRIEHYCKLFKSILAENICPNCNLSGMWGVIRLILTPCFLWNIFLSAWDIRQNVLVVVYWKFDWYVFVKSVAYRTLYDTLYC